MVGSEGLKPDITECRQQMVSDVPLVALPRAGLDGAPYGGQPPLHVLADVLGASLYEFAPIQAGFQPVESLLRLSPSPETSSSHLTTRRPEGASSR